MEKTMDETGIHYVYQDDDVDVEHDSSQDDEPEEEYEETPRRHYEIVTAVTGGAEIKSEAPDDQSDATSSVRAILVDGQYYLTNGDQTLLFQDSDEGSDPLHQYYINDNSENCCYAEAITDDASSSLMTEDDSTQFVRIVDDSNDNSDQQQQQQQVYYYTDASVDDSNDRPKRIKLEGQMVDLEAFLQQQQQVDGHDVHYAVMEDGSIHKIANVDETMDAVFEEEEEAEVVEIEDEADEENGEEEEEKEEEEPETPEVESIITDNREVDLSQITGTNLLTGQKVTLHTYMEKLQKQLKKTGQLPVPPLINIKRRGEDGSTKPNGEDNLLNKTIPIGKTKNGKQIIGKIVKVEKKTEEQFFPLPLTEDEEDEDEEEVEEIQQQQQQQQTMVVSKPKVIAARKKSPVTRETFEEISKTLGGVMEMESVRKKLVEKNIVVKLVEKKYVAATESFSKSSSYSYGYMERECDERGEEKWKFVPDQDTQDAILEQIDDLQDDRGGDEEKRTKKTTKYALTTSLTILISHAQGGNKTIRVNLSPAPGNMCTICSRYFRSNGELKIHMKCMHDDNRKVLKCEICSAEFENDVAAFDEHKTVHVKEGRLFVCPKCKRFFPSETRLHKHLHEHHRHHDRSGKLPFDCSMCPHTSSSEWALKQHLLTHLRPVKPHDCDICGKAFSTVYDMNFHRKCHFIDRSFVCSVCLRTFGRHSNLLRHMTIHEGSGALYKCEVCYSSYTFASSLTRHIVQNHINVGDFRRKTNASDESTASS